MAREPTMGKCGHLEKKIKGLAMGLTVEKF
jgi:hypothetical protein